MQPATKISWQNKPGKKNPGEKNLGENNSGKENPARKIPAKQNSAKKIAKKIKPNKFDLTKSAWKNCLTYMLPNLLVLLPLYIHSSSPQTSCVTTFSQFLLHTSVTWGTDLKKRKHRTKIVIELVHLTHWVCNIVQVQKVVCLLKYLLYVELLYSQV